MDIEKIASSRELRENSLKWVEPRSLNNTGVIDLVVGGFVESGAMLSTAFAASLIPFGIIGLTFFAANRGS